MSEVDGMGLIEHEINWCDTFECDGPAREDPEYLGTCDECGAELVRVKVVRADTARGAVDRIAGIEAALRLALARGTFDATDAAVLRASLPDQRGQSEAEVPVPREWTLRASGDINGGTGQCERSIHAAGPELRGIKPVRVREIPS